MDPSVMKEAEEAISNLLPSKSKSKYEKSYKFFNDWRMKKNIKELDEIVMLAYFHEKSKTLKASTMWSNYSMLKCMIQLNENLDISTFKKVIAFLKRQNDTYTLKKSKVLTFDNVSCFLTSAPDREFLFMKVVLIFGLNGACRGDELRLLTLNDVEDTGSVIVITLNDTKNKKKRVFTITNDETPVNGVELYRKYRNMRPATTSHNRVFVCYRNNKCTVQPVGINTFYSIPRNIAMFLKLSEPEKYTGHCIRRTSATLLANSGADEQSLKRHGGWSSSKVAEGYVEESIETKIQASRKVFNVNPKPSTITSSSLGTAKSISSVIPSNSAPISSGTVSATNVTSADFQLSSVSGISFSNLENCTFNFYTNSKE